MFEKIDRVVIAVDDLEEARSFFSDLLEVSFDMVGEEERVGLRGCYSACGLELIAPTRPDSTVGKFIKERGQGLWAIVLKVKNMDEAVRKLKEKGLRVVGESIVGSMREVAFHPKESRGVEIILAEYAEKHPATIAAWSEGGQVPLQKLKKEEG